VYLKAGTERDKTAVLVVLGVDEQGHKELLAMDEGYRESTASWSEVLRSLRERGLAQAPLLAIGDGALGLWAALDEIFPTTRLQRCWNHRALNVLDKLPKRLQPEMRKQLHALAEAPNRQECERRRDALCAKLRDLRQESAAACVERDWEDFVTLYDFPEEHWVHLRTSNPASTATKLTSTSSLFPSSPSPISNPPFSAAFLGGAHRTSRGSPASPIATTWLASSPVAGGLIQTSSSTRVRSTRGDRCH